MQNLPRSRSTAIVLSVGVILIYLAIGLVRVYPYVDDVTQENSAGDDWLTYKKNAINILDGGLEIPRVPRAYYTPGGFLYNYFVAAIFAIFGPNPAWVYVIQFAGLGLASALMFILARRFMPGPWAVVYLVACAVFLYDAFSVWARRLLSENLTVMLYPLVFILLASGMERRSAWRCAASGFVAGLVVLSRPNLIGLPILLSVLALFSGGRPLARVTRLAAFSLAAAGAFAVLPLRNAIVTGHFVLSRRYGSLLPRGTAGELARVIGEGLINCFGVMTTARESGGTDLVIVSRHWLVMNVVALAALVVLILLRRFRIVDAMCVMTIVAAYVPFAVLQDLGGYGMRFQYPYGPVLLFLIFRSAYELHVRRVERAELVRAARPISSKKKRRAGQPH